MSEELNNCTGCGRELPSPDWNAPCPRCLLAEGLNSDRTIAMPGGSRPHPPEKIRDRAPSSDKPEKPSSENSAAAYAPSLEEMEDLFPEFETSSLLGAGGMGAVYKIRQPRLDRFAALKILGCPPEHHESFALRFEREAQMLAKLNHPNIVTIYDFGEREWKRSDQTWDALFFFLMEFVDGADLSQLIRTKELTPKQALGIVPQICEALQFAHDEGITHRDIKPANILLDQKGQVKIADFGLAKLIEGKQDAIATGLTLTGTSMGTPYYMAPEQFESPENVDHRADIYSLGVVFYEMLTGDRPHGLFSPPSEKVGVDARIDAVVLKAMEKEPGARYQQASEVSQDVTRVSTEAIPKRKLRQKGGAGKWIAAAGVALLGAGVWWLVDRGTSPPANISTVTTVVETASGKAARNGVSGATDFDQQVEPGRLLGRGTFLNGDPIDLSQAEPYDDIVDIVAGPWRWWALRSNGDVISSAQWSVASDVDRFADVGRGSRCAVIKKNGKLEYLDSTSDSEFPEPVRKARIINAAVHENHNLAITDEGTVVPWGEIYDGEVGDSTNANSIWSPKFPEPPSAALIDAADCAVTGNHAVILGKDGRLWIWNWEGLVDLAIPDEMPSILSVQGMQSGILLSDAIGGIWRLRFPFNPSPDQPIRDAYRFVRLGDGKLMGDPYVWQDQQGRSRSWNPELEPIIEPWLEEMPGGPFAKVVARSQTGSEQDVGGKDGFVLWIGSNEDARQSEIKDPPAISPGPLRAEGTLMDGTPIDLSRTQPYDDFTDLATAALAWFALRSNGDVIASDPEHNVTGIRKFADDISFKQAAAISREGKLVFLGSQSTPQPPKELATMEVIDAAVTHMHGIALAADGTGIVWGERYDGDVGDASNPESTFSPRWPKPSEEALRDLVDVAVTSNGCASVNRDGQLFVWNWSGMVEIIWPKGAVEIAEIKSEIDKLLLGDRDGGIWEMSLPRNPDPRQPVGRAYGIENVEAKKLGHGGIGGESRFWRDLDGRWDCEEDGKGASQIRSRLAKLPTERFSLVGGVEASNWDKNGSWRKYLMWIESEKIPDESAVESDLPGTRNAEGGTLRGKGVHMDGSPVDLSAAEGVTDFVDVEVTSSHWIGLRSNGDLVSSDADFSSSKKIARFVDNLAFSKQVAVLSCDGGLVFLGHQDTPEPPAKLDELELKDAALAWDHGLALASDGNVVAWGDVYEGEIGDDSDPTRKWSPRWPRPSSGALKNIVDVAVTSNGAATLSADGKLYVWNWNGPAVIELPDNAEPFSALSSMGDALLLESADGVVWNIALPRNPSPGQPVMGAFECRRMARGRLAGTTHFWRSDDGTWNQFVATTKTTPIQEWLEELPSERFQTVAGREFANWGGTDEWRSCLFWIEL